MQPAMFRRQVFAGDSAGAGCWIIPDFEPRVMQRVEYRVRSDLMKCCRW